MLNWAKTADGWAVNLDGTHAATGFSLPRLELHCSPRGWQCLCLLADGTAHRTRAAMDSTPSAKRAVVEKARSVLGPRYAGVLDELGGR